MASYRYQWRANKLLNIMRFILLITFSTLCFSEIKTLDPRLHGMSLERARELRGEPVKRSGYIKRENKDKVIRRKRLRLRPYFSKREENIQTLEQFYVLISGNLKIMGSATERIKVFALSKDFPKGSYFSCNSYNSAIQYHYRIKFRCDKLVTPKKEYLIKAHIKDLKKISGVTPDHVSTGEEEGIVKQFVLGITAYMLDTDKKRELTNNGYQEVPSDSNALKSATVEGIKDINSGLSSKDSKSLVLAMKGQKKAIIEFLEPFNFGRENDEV